MEVIDIPGQLINFGRVMMSHRFLFLLQQFEWLQGIFELSLVFYDQVFLVFNCSCKIGRESLIDDDYFKIERYKSW